MDKKTVYIGGDHQGHELRATFTQFLKDQGHHVVELGVFNGDDTPYEIIEREIKEKAQEEDGIGIIVFGAHKGGQAKSSDDAKADASEETSS